MIPENDLIVLDTNILVAYIRGNDLAKCIEQQYKLLERNFRPLICCVTSGEMLALAAKLGWGDDKKQKLKNMLSELIVLDINNDEVLNRYADIDFYLSKLKPAVIIQQNDLWIAAVASCIDAHLISTDTGFNPLDSKWIKFHLIDERIAK